MRRVDKRNNQERVGGRRDCGESRPLSRPPAINITHLSQEASHCLGSHASTHAHMHTHTHTHRDTEECMNVHTQTHTEWQSSHSVELIPSDRAENRAWKGLQWRATEMGRCHETSITTSLGSVIQNMGCVFVASSAARVFDWAWGKDGSLSLRITLEWDSCSHHRCS